MKRIFAVLVAAVFLFGSTFSFAATDLLLSDKALYMAIEKHNIEKLLSNLDEFANLDIVKFLESETPLKMEANIEIDSNVEGFIKREIKVLDEINEDKTYENAKISIYNEGQYIATIEAILDDNVLSVRIPELYEKYLTIDLGNLKEFYQKFDIPEEDLLELEESYKLQEELKTLMVLSEEQEDALMSCLMKCGMTLNELIKDEYFIRDDNAVISYDGKIIPCTSLSLEIPQSDMVQIAKAVWNEFKNDEKVMKILEEKLNGFYKIYEEQLEKEKNVYESEYGMVFQDEIKAQLPTVLELYLAVDEMLCDLEMIYGPEYDTGRIVSKIYFEDDFDIIKREFGIKNESTNYNAMYALTTAENYYALAGDGFLLEDRIFVNGNLTTHQFKYEYLSYDYDWDEDWNLIKTEKLETTELAINVERVSEKAFRMWADFDEFNRLEIALSTETLNENSAVMNCDVFVLEKADPSLQTFLPQEDKELTVKTKMIVLRIIKLRKKNLIMRLI